MILYLHILLFIRLDLAQLLTIFSLSSNILPPSYLLLPPFLLSSFLLSSFPTSYFLLPTFLLTTYYLLLYYLFPSLPNTSSHYDRGISKSRPYRL